MDTSTQQEWRQRINAEELAVKRRSLGIERHVRSTPQLRGIDHKKYALGRREHAAMNVLSNMPLADASEYFGPPDTQYNSILQSTDRELRCQRNRDLSALHSMGTLPDFKVRQSETLRTLRYQYPGSWRAINNTEAKASMPSFQELKSPEAAKRFTSLEGTKKHGETIAVASAGQRSPSSTTSVSSPTTKGGAASQPSLQMSRFIDSIGPADGGQIHRIRRFPQSTERILW
eukprot:2352856-Pleurochrysis_carterae.AAC.3